MRIKEKKYTQEEYLVLINNRLKAGFSNPDEYAGFLDCVRWKEQIRRPPPLLRCKNDMITDGKYQARGKTLWDFCLYSAPTLNELKKIKERFEVIKPILSGLTS